MSAGIVMLVHVTGSLVEGSEVIPASASWWGRGLVVMVVAVSFGVVPEGPPLTGGF
jgi:hypothetical protein